PDRAVPAAPEAPGTAPVQAVDDPRRAQARYPVRRPGHPHSHGRPRHPADKQQTWQAVTRAAPARVFFGWKNFYVKDHPMMSPQQIVATAPHMSMISYQ